MSQPNDDAPKLSFEDKEGRSWTPSVKLDTAERLKAKLSFDLYDVKAFLALFEDWMFAGNVLFFLCFDEAKERNIDQKAFCSALDAGVIEEGVNCTGRALVDFFPQGQREQVTVALAEMNKALAKDRDRAKKMMRSGLLGTLLDQEHQKIDSVIDEAISQAESDPSKLSLKTFIDSLRSQEQAIQDATDTGT